MSGNMFHQIRPESLVILPEGVSESLQLETSREVELTRLEAKLVACGDNWRSAERVQAKIDELKSRT